MRGWIEGRVGVQGIWGLALSCGAREPGKRAGTAPDLAETVMTMVAGEDRPG